jgi:1,4-alpha-glucan branching enzyme
MPTDKKKPAPKTAANASAKSTAKPEKETVAVKPAAAATATATAIKPESKPATASKPDSDDRFISEYDLHLLGEGTHYRIYEKLGAHIIEQDGQEGTHFAVWAPSATAVSVIGDFNGWEPGKNKLERIGGSGIWACFVAGVLKGANYKFFIDSDNPHASREKCDPLAFASELRPKTASVVWDLETYEWQDADWMKSREKANALDAPVSIYEVHLASWMRVPEEENRWLTYRELADKLTNYVKDMGFTHIELMPIAEHPLDLSWGYQTVGYYAPTSRFGTPDDFKYFVDKMHQAGIGIILDWVPSHFPKDGHGLGLFDGTHLYEHADPRQGEHKEWGTYVFNYGRYEVSNFLISNALFWLDQYHLDGLRVDAVASMLYLDYARKDGEWLANHFGGRENLEAIAFLKRLNERVYLEKPDVLMIAEESTAWPQVSKPTYVGGLGFGLKWDMGWMHDTLEYMSLQPIHRKYHHNKMTFRGLYAYSENFVLSVSHDEVVYGKRSMLNKMPGDDWQKFANLRSLFGYMFTLTGKKLMFMGGEFGQWNEWYHEVSLDWHLLDHPLHKGMQRWVKDLNHFYTKDRALFEQDKYGGGFEWIDCQDIEQSIFSYLRFGTDPSDVLAVACNFTPVPRHDYYVGVPRGGYWKEVLNSDASEYGGSGMGNFGGVFAEDWSCHARSNALKLTLPPLSISIFKWQGHK